MSDPTTSAPAPTKSSIQIRIDAARAKLDAAKGRLSDADRAEIAEREELARVADAQAEEDAIERGLDLDRRLDLASEKHPGVKLATVMIKSCEDTFIVKANTVAYKAWDKTINDAGNRKLDPQEERRKLVAASVVDWNGKTDFGPTGLDGPALVMHLSKNQGIVAPVIQEILVLNGVVKEDRKSTG